MSTRIKKLKRERNFPFRPLPKGEHGGIELLLVHSVDSLGKQGEVVEVRPGYAYNFLIPHGLATLASDHHKRMVDKHKVKLQQIELARQAELRKLALEIAKQSITIENEISLSTDQIRLDGPLKELGLYTVKFRLSSEVEGEVKVWVVPAVATEAT